MEKFVKYVAVGFALLICISIFGEVMDRCSGSSFGTDEDGAIRVLTSSGYTDIEFLGYDYLNGSEGDFYKTKFMAKSPNGTIVIGCVTRGLFKKGNTIRLNN